MKEIRLGARLSAYSRVEALITSDDLEKMNKCDVDKIFGQDCNECDTCDNTPLKEGEVTRADIDALFR